MKTLTDLEICKKIAEIEGYGPNEINDKADVIWVLFGHATMEFNPLADKALLFDLMLKYNVTLENYSSLHYASIERITHRADSDEDVPRAVLLAIIEAQNDG